MQRAWGNKSQPIIKFGGEKTNNIFVGIDVAKENHEASIKDRAGNELVNTFTITNTENDVQKLYNIVDDLCKKYGAEPLFAMEATGIYYLPLYTRLVRDGKQVKLFNPIQTSSLREKNIRKSSTDKIDSRLIADLLRYEGIKNQREIDTETMQLKELCRTYWKFTDKISDTKRQIVRCLDMIFPGYTEIFSGTFNRTSMVIMKKYTTPSEILKAKETTLTMIVKKNSRGQLGSEKVKEIIELARKTINVIELEYACKIEIQMLLEQINLIEKQLKGLEKQIKRFSDREDIRLIMSIDSFGKDGVLAHTLAAEIGSIDDFRTSDQLLAYLGEDPSIKQSGRFERTIRHWSKRGSPLARRILYLASISAIRINPVCINVYERKYDKNNPKRKWKSAICAVMGKLTRIVFSVLKNKKPFYVPSYITQPVQTDFKGCLNGSNAAFGNVATGV